MHHTGITPNIEKLFEEALAFYRSGELEKAAAMYGAALKISPEFVPALVRRGLVLVELERPDEAMPDFERALELDPGYGLAYFGRGWVRGFRGDHQGELEDGQRGLELDAENAQIYYRRIGWALKGLTRYGEALDAFARSLALDPDQPGTLFNRGCCYAEIGDYEGALADFNRALEFDPDWSWALHWRGWVYLQMGDADRAIIDCTHAIRFNPKTDQGYLRRGMAYLKKGMTDEAAADFKQAIQQARVPGVREEAQEYLDHIESGR